MRCHSGFENTMRMKSHSPKDEQSRLFKTARPNRLFSEPPLLYSWLYPQVYYSYFYVQLLLFSTPCKVSNTIYLRHDLQTLLSQNWWIFKVFVGILEVNVPMTQHLSLAGQDDTPTTRQDRGSNYQIIQHNTSMELQLSNKDHQVRFVNLF